MKKMNKKGFTIVELVIVIAVIAILAAVMIPTFSGIVQKANASKALQQARNIYTEVYAEDIADGSVDGTFADAGYTLPANVTYTPNAQSGNKFVYSGVSGFSAEFDGTTWAVESSN